MDYEQTLEELRETLDDLRELNHTIPIIVEGEKDVEALRRLNILGTIIRLNKGISISLFCDQITHKYDTVILLTDWDRKGGHLFSLLKKHLKGRVECISVFREVFAKRCTVRTVEGLPSWIETLNKKINQE